MAEDKKKKKKDGRGPNSITVTHGETEYTIDIDKELEIDELDIKTCYGDQAGKFAWYAVVHAGAMRRVDTMKTRVDVLRAEISVAKAKASVRLKKEMTTTEEIIVKGRGKDADGNQKKDTKKPKITVPSQSAIDAIVDSASEVIEARSAVDRAQQSLVQARYEQEVVKAAKDAFVHRRDMLIQMGADVRQEQRDRS